MDSDEVDDELTQAAAAAAFTDTLSTDLHYKQRNLEGARLIYQSLNIPLNKNNDAAFVLMRGDVYNYTWFW